MKRRLALLVAGLLAAPALFAADAARAGDPPPLPPPSGAPAATGAPPASGELPAASTTPPPASTPPTTEPPRPAPPEVPPPPEDDSLKSRLSLKLDGGYGFRQIAGRPSHGVDFLGAIGAQDHRFGGYATLEVLVGRTFSDLATRTIKVGAIAEWRVHSILRLGVGGDLGYVVVDRATTDRSMSALGIGVFGLGTVDLYSFGPRGDHAVYLGARFHAAAHFGATEWGPSAAVGFRY